MGHQHQSQGSPQHQYHSQMPPYSSRNKPPETHTPAVGVGPAAPPQMSRSSSVMSSYHSSYNELGSGRSVSVSSSRPSLHETDSTPPPPLPTRNNIQHQQNQNKEPSPPLSMASSSTSSRKASLSEDKENQRQGAYQNIQSNGLGGGRNKSFEGSQ